MELIVDSRKAVVLFRRYILREVELDEAVGGGEGWLVGESELGRTGGSPALLIEPASDCFSSVLLGQGNLMVGDVADLEDDEEVFLDLDLFDG